MFPEPMLKLRFAKPCQFASRRSADHRFRIQGGCQTPTQLGFHLCPRDLGGRQNFFGNFQHHAFHGDTIIGSPNPCETFLGLHLRQLLKQHLARQRKAPPPPPTSNSVPSFLQFQRFSFQNFSFTFPAPAIRRRQSCRLFENLPQRRTPGPGSLRWIEDHWRKRQFAFSTQQRHSFPMKDLNTMDPAI